MALVNYTKTFTATGDGDSVAVGKGEFGFSYGVGTSPSGTLVLEISFDAGSTWMGLARPTTATAASLTAAGCINLCSPMEGALVRGRCSAYTSGTIQLGIHQ